MNFSEFQLVFAGLGTADAAIGRFRENFLSFFRTALYKTKFVCYKPLENRLNWYDIDNIMIKLSKMTDYGVVIMSEMARRRRKSSGFWRKARSSPRSAVPMAATASRTRRKISRSPRLSAPWKGRLRSPPASMTVSRIARSSPAAPCVAAGRRSTGRSTPRSKT